MPSTYITNFVQVLYEVRSRPPLRGWHKNVSSPTPCDLHLFRFMITFASCFPIHKDSIQNIFKMQGRSHYLGPLIWGMSLIIQLYPTLKKLCKFDLCIWKHLPSRISLEILRYLTKAEDPPPQKDIFHFGKVSQIRVAFTYKYELQTMWLSSKDSLLPSSCRLSRTSDLRSILNWEWKFASSMLCQCRLINRQSPFNFHFGHNWKNPLPRRNTNSNPSPGTATTRSGDQPDKHFSDMLLKNEMVGKLYSNFRIQMFCRIIWQGMNASWPVTGISSSSSSTATPVLVQGRCCCCWCRRGSPSHDILSDSESSSRRTYESHIQAVAEPGDREKRKPNEVCNNPDVVSSQVVQLQSSKPDCNNPAWSREKWPACQTLRFRETETQHAHKNIDEGIAR